MTDELLLQAILDRPNGDILNIVSLAAEHEGDLNERLSKAYYEVTNNDPGAGDQIIGLTDLD
jgi:hypothetical protein